MVASNIHPPIDPSVHHHPITCPSTFLTNLPIHPSPSPLPAHLVYVFVPYREGEGEAQGQLLVLHLMLVQEVRDALRDVVKELGVASAWH